LFKPFLPEEAQVNPQCYGAELAWWLSRALADKGVSTSYPNFEDWGWFIEYIIDGSEYWLCCGNLSGTENEWSIFLEPKSKGLFGRHKAPIEKAAKLLATLNDVLTQSSGISNINWSNE
jgi:hypothetical protein